MWRAVRRWATARATGAAVAAAPWLSPRAIDRLAAVAARCGPALPLVARMVAENMRAVGVYSPAVHRAYFAQMGQHFAGALHALRCGRPESAEGLRAALAGLVGQRVILDESVARLSEAVGRGGGAILVGPHITNYLLNLARLNQAVPLTVYLRYSKDPRRRAIKQRWYQATGVRWISEPAGTDRLLGRLGRMAAAVRDGRVLFITPDLARRRDDGAPVEFCGREIYLPTGAALLAARTGAPLFMLAAQSDGPRQRLLVRGPFGDPPAWGGRDARRAGIQQRLQWFASELARFLMAQPALWYLWGDKRWTRVLHDDPRYVRRLAPSPAQAVAAGAAGVT